MESNGQVGMNPKLRSMFGGGSVQTTEVANKIIRITFNDQGIGGTSEHLEELDAIRTASDGDVVALYFSGCPGGVIDTGMAIINAILATSAKTVAIIEGHNASLATMIPMVCDEVVVTPHATMMLHTANGGMYGTIPNVERQAVFFAARVKAFIDDVYSGFLTKEEIAQLHDGVEMYLTDDEIKERLEKRTSALVAEAKAELEEVAEAVPVPKKPVAKKAPARKTRNK